jgi:hypothetical protein
MERNRLRQYGFAAHSQQPQPPLKVAILQAPTSESRIEPIYQFEITPPHAEVVAGKSRTHWHTQKTVEPIPPRLFKKTPEFTFANILP